MISDNSIYEYMIKVCGKKIGVFANVPETEKIVINPKHKSDEKYDYSIFLLKSETINGSYIKDSLFNTIAKLIDDNIEENVCFNYSYEWAFGKIKEYTFPGNCIVINNNNNNNYVIASQYDVLLFYFKKIIKEIIADIYCSRGYEQIHASGVEKNDKAILFIGDGFSGKSTNAIRLIKKGYKILNDDMLFLKEKDNKLFVTGIPICCSLRNNALDYIDIELKNDSTYNSKYQETNYCTGLPYNSNEVMVQTIVFLCDCKDPHRINSYGEIDNKTEIEPIKRCYKHDKSNVHFWVANKENASTVVNKEYE